MTTTTRSRGTVLAGLAALFVAGTSSAHGQVFEQSAKVFADDADAFDRFGTSVAVDGDLIVIGASRNDDAGDESGSVYLFDGRSFTQQSKLVASDAEAFDRFGISVDAADGIVVVGANADDGLASRAGSAYLFDADTATELFQLQAGDGIAGNLFGNSVSIADGLVVVGAPGDDVNGAGSGSAYLFDAGTGAELLKLIPADGSANDSFGTVSRSASSRSRT